MRKSIQTFLVGVGVLVVLSASAGCKDKGQLRARVDCVPNLQGLGCKVKHVEGKTSAKVCWSVFLTCQGGSTVQADACASVDPDGHTFRQMTNADIVGTNRTCKQVVSTRLKVTSVSAE